MDLPNRTRGFGNGGEISPWHCGCTTTLNQFEMEEGCCRSHFSFFVCLFRGRERERGKLVLVDKNFKPH